MQIQDFDIDLGPYWDLSKAIRHCLPLTLTSKSGYSIQFTQGIVEANGDEWLIATGVEGSNTYDIKYYRKLMDSVLIAYTMNISTHSPILKTALNTEVDKIAAVKYNLDTKKCECGADTAGLPYHSHWCPKFDGTL